MSAAHRPPASVPAEIAVDVALVRRLLAAQHPDLCHERLEPFAEGWDNVMCRLGSSRLVRLPRRRMGGDAIERELSWLPRLASHLPLPIPVAERVGWPEPTSLARSERYPYAWSVVPWFDAAELGVCRDVDEVSTARSLGEFLRALHTLAAPPDGPRNPYRGVSLSQREEQFARVRGSLAARFDDRRIASVWGAACSAAPWDGPACWCHGDMHPFNVLAKGGRPVAVIDWGDLHVGEPAPDLAGVWMATSPSVHAAFLDAYGTLDAATWARARGWALYFAATLVNAADDGAGDAFRTVGLRTAQRALAESTP